MTFLISVNLKKIANGPAKAWASKIKILVIKNMSHILIHNHGVVSNIHDNLLRVYLNLNNLFSMSSNILFLIS